MLSLDDSLGMGDLRSHRRQHSRGSGHKLDFMEDPARLIPTKDAGASKYDLKRPWNRHST